MVDFHRCIVSSCPRKIWRASQFFLWWVLRVHCFVNLQAGRYLLLIVCILVVSACQCLTHCQLKVTFGVPVCTTMKTIIYIDVDKATRPADMSHMIKSIRTVCVQYMKSVHLYWLVSVSICVYLSVQDEAGQYWHQIQTVRIQYIPHHSWFIGLYPYILFVLNIYQSIHDLFASIGVVRIFLYSRWYALVFS